jgi:hypothetical protein
LFSTKAAVGDHEPPRLVLNLNYDLNICSFRRLVSIFLDKATVLETNGQLPARARACMPSVVRLNYREIRDPSDDLAAQRPGARQLHCQYGRQVTRSRSTHRAARQRRQSL